MVDWSTLPEDLLCMIVVRLFSAVEFKRFRSICRSDSDLGSEKIHLLNPLSRVPLQQSNESIDLLEFSVSEIREAFMIQTSRLKKLAHAFNRVILVPVAGGRDPLIFGIGFDGKIRYWNGEIWTRIEDQMADFSDIIVHKGLTYALDSSGGVWWISSSLSVYRFGPSLDEDDITSDCCSEKSFVECCGELYIVDRLLEVERRKKKVDNIDDNGNYVVRFPKLMYAIHDNAGIEICKLAQGKRPKTVTFKVFKMDEESGKWVEVKSLGDNAIVLATDCCFSVLAHEFYGCLQNSVYYSDDEDELKVFKLDDGSMLRT